MRESCQKISKKMKRLNFNSTKPAWKFKQNYCDFQCCVKIIHRKTTRRDIRVNESSINTNFIKKYRICYISNSCGGVSAFKHYCEKDNIDNTVISHTLGGSKCFSHSIEDQRIPPRPKCSSWWLKIMIHLLIFLQVILSNFIEYGCFQ